MIIANRTKSEGWICGSITVAIAVVAGAFDSPANTCLIWQTGSFQCLSMRTHVARARQELTAMGSPQIRSVALPHPNRVQPLSLLLPTLTPIFTFT